MKEELKNKVFSVFDKLAIAHHDQLFLTSSKIDTALFISFEDNSDDQTKLAIETNKLKIYEMWGPK